MGGPYSSRDDAERAIRSGSFEQDPAELTVRSGGDKDERKEAKTAAFAPYETPTTKPSASPATPDVPELGQPVPEMSFPKTTKPAQMPSGGGGLPQSPASEQFDPGATSEPGPDPVASTMASVTAAVRQSNPELDEPTLQRIAVRVAMRLHADFNPYAEMPNIEDPLANKTPLQVLHDIRRTLPQSRSGDDEREEPEEEGTPPQEPERQESEGDEPSGTRLPFSRIPDLSEFDRPARAGAGEAAEGAAARAGAGAAGRAMLARLPMLLV